MTDITILNDFAVPTDDHARDTSVYCVKTQDEVSYMPGHPTSWCRNEKRALEAAREMVQAYDVGATVQKFTFKLSKRGVLDLLRFAAPCGGA
tara:strand:- start:151 stop:426 length:276 start_codon:yes stop_codon:yes gene_type:complete